MLSHLVLLDFFDLLEAFLLLTALKDYEALLFGARVLILLNLLIADAVVRRRFAHPLHLLILFLFSLVEAVFVDHLVEVLIF